MRAAGVLSAIIVAFAAASAAMFLRDTIVSYVHRTPFVIGVPAAAAVGLRVLIPKGETLGFISDGNDLNAIDRSLYGITYSLAPLIVEHTANRRFVVGDFRSKSSIPKALTQYRLRIVEDLGNGFLLLAAQ